MRMRMKMSVNFEILMREDVPVDILFSLSFFEISFFQRPPDKTGREFMIS